jgi:hypothetical protein
MKIIFLVLIPFLAFSCLTKDYISNNDITIASNKLSINKVVVLPIIIAYSKLISDNQEKPKNSYDIDYIATNRLIGACIKNGKIVIDMGEIIPGISLDSTIEKKMNVDQLLWTNIDGKADAVIQTIIYINNTFVGISLKIIDAKTKQTLIIYNDSVQDLWVGLFPEKKINELIKKIEDIIIEKL